ncbi:MAG: hypothetical protein DRG78_10490 [Epsilonproteobacteria bacterium]|nr:MAG: hypothetical protein DRG78_10490 [Campylobacterota bacterium]
MVKIIIFLLLLVNYLLATTYNFTEVRYSDALDKKIKFQGTITFVEDGLSIKYPKENKSLTYKNNVLIYEEDDKKISLENIQEKKVIQYFKILILVHNANINEIKNIFTVIEKNSKTILLPITSLSQYIKKVELLKYNNKLNQIQLFLQNNDSIKININNEI